MSNSSLLEQAIVDAQALRDAAFKSAQSALLEKYAPQIKEAVEKLLEQDEDPTATGDPAAAAAGAAEMSAVQDMSQLTSAMGDESGMGKAVVVGAAKEIPLAATDGEKLCQCPDEEEEVEINFDELQKQLASQEEEPEEHEELAADMGAAMPEDETATGNAPAQPMAESVSVDEELTLSEADLVGYLEEEMKDEEDKKEEPRRNVAGTHLDHIMSGKKAKDCAICMGNYDVDEAKDGVPETDKEKKLAALAPPADKITRADVVTGRIKGGKQEAVHEETLHESKTVELLTASAQLIREHKSLQESMKKKEKEFAKLLEENREFKSIIKDMSDSLDKLDEVNLMNARLYYTNQVLKSASLNERQKNKIADAISKADSVNEAKAVYETLIDSVGSSPDTKNTPKSLNEVLTKSSSFRLPHKHTENNVADPLKERLLKLAGIK